MTVYTIADNRSHRVIVDTLGDEFEDVLDATNNQAERMPRPAVITRKTGSCNRNEQGADTHAILSSLLVTCKQRRQIASTI